MLRFLGGAVSVCSLTVVLAREQGREKQRSRDTDLRIKTFESNLLNIIACKK
jgi:hypothetical protein